MGLFDTIYAIFHEIPQEMVELENLSYFLLLELNSYIPFALTFSSVSYIIPVYVGISTFFL